MSKVIFITGISSGFGKYTASLLAEGGHKVYGTSRRDTEHDPRVNVLFLDVTDLPAVESCIRTVLEKEGRIDVLINNAGMHTGGAIEVTPYDDIRRQIDTNLFGAIHTIRAVLPAMRKQGSGTIINISSIGGLMGLPFQAFYSASKFAIEGLSEALRMELKQFKIRVVVVNPGDFHTHNTVNRKNVFVRDENNAYEEQFKKSLAIIEKDENGGWAPEILARKIMKIVESKNPCNRYVVSSFEQKLAVILKYIMPGSWFSKILEDHYGLKG
jgi:NAD(P)-dependent dehydrogenase (short-subunit alcohol dehydrogenase family)